MDIKDSYLHGTIGVVKSIDVDEDNIKYTLADTANTSKLVPLPVVTTEYNGIVPKITGTTTRATYDYKTLTVDSSGKLNWRLFPTIYRTYNTLEGIPTNGNTQAWYNILTIADHTNSPCIFIIKAYAHSSAIFTVSKGFATSGNITLLNYAQSPNSNYAYIKGARLLSNGVVLVLLNVPKANNATYVQINAAVYNATGAKPNSTLVLQDSLPSDVLVVDTKEFISSSIMSDKFVGNLTGNATTATKLATKRKLWGLDFDGSADVSGNMTGVGVINGIFKVTSIQNIAQLNVSEVSTYVNYSHLYVSSNNTSYPNTRPLVLQYGYGNVGIGVIAPSEKLEVSGNVKATTFIGNLDGTYVDKLTGYTKATAIGSIAATDSLNTALGKLEYKTDFIYNDLFGTDTDEYINKWGEIVGFLDSVKEGTDILDEFVTQKTDLTITGAKIFSGTTATLLTIDRNSTNPAWIRFMKNNSLLGYIGIDNNNNPVFLSGVSGSANQILLHSGNYTTWINTTNFPGLDKTGTVTSIKVGSTSYSPSSGVVSLPAYPTSLKSPNTIKFKNTAGTVVSYDGSTAVDLTGGVNYATDATNLLIYKNLTRHVYTTVKATKDQLKVEFGNVKLCVGSAITIPHQTLSNWNNESFAYDSGGIYTAIKLSGGYSGNTYGLWLLSAYGDERLYYVGLYDGEWTTLRKIANTNDIPTKTSQLTNDSGFITGGPYLPLSGGTMTGVITTATGNLLGLKFGTSHLTSLSNLLLWQSSEAIRFGSSSWDWNCWAGLKYDHPNKIIYLGLADGTTFNANTAQSGGKVKFPGVSDVYVNRLIISSTEGSVKHLQFSRGSYNYISAPSGGTIVMLPNGVSASSSSGMTFTSSGFYPQTNKGYSLGTSSYRWSTVYGDCGNFTGAITSSLTTGSHLKGNQGTAIINSTAAAGYNMLARMKSTNGVFTTGAYNAAFMLYYTADSTITAGTDGTTKNVTLLDESGNTTFSGRVQSSNFKSTATTGTQPYVCASTTCNTNLNADLLDGTHKADLLTSVTSDATTNLSVVVGGTTKSITDLYARKLVKSTNTITSTAQDTTANWGALNNTMHYYNSVLLTDQPSLYGLLLNFNTGTSEVHQIWMTQTSGSLYHRGGNASGWSGSWRRIIDSADAASVKTWTASIKGQTWSRLCKVDYATSVVGSSYIINIKGTRSSVVYNNTYMVNTHHEGKGNVVAIGASKYTEVTVRVCVDTYGNSYFELKDSAQSIATSTSQSVYCTLVPMGCGSVTLYTAFTSGATLDSGYTAGTELITRAIDSGIHAANFSASELTRSALFALQKNTSTQSYMHTYISTVGTTSTGGLAYLKIGNAVATGSVDNARGILCVYGTGASGALIKCDSTSANDYELMLPAAAGRLVYHTTGSLIGSGTKPIYVSSVGKATASTSTIGNRSNPVYLSAGTITACSYPKSGAYFQGVPSVSSGGVTEIGRYLNFHPTNTSTLDFSARLDCGTSTTARTITLPDYPGTLLLHHGSMTRNTSDDTHAKAISDYFTTNKTTMPRNMLHSLYSPAYGDGSCAFGYLLNGYDANPFGGYFVAHYKKAWYVGIDNGSYQLYRIATAALANISSDKKPLYIDDGNLKPCLVESHTSSYAYYGTNSFNVKLTRFQIQSNLYIINIRSSIPSGCYSQKGKELYTTAVTSGGTIYTLPSGYRPAETITTCVYAADSNNENEAAVNIAIFKSGKIRFHGGVTMADWTSESNNLGLNMWYLGTGS